MKRPWRRYDRPLIRAIQERHPGFKEAVLADLSLERSRRGERDPLTSKAEVVFELIRVAIVSDGFGALLLYRIRTTCQRRHIPFLPAILHRASISWSQLSIGDPVLVQPGVRFPHGQVVVDGFAEIRTGAEIRPFVTIGLREGDFQGPTIGEHVKVGTGAKVIGPVVVGDRAMVGANAVVLDDVPAGAVVVGAPARPTR